MCTYCGFTVRPGVSGFEIDEPIGLMRHSVLKRGARFPTRAWFRLRDSGSLHDWLDWLDRIDGEVTVAFFTLPDSEGVWHPIYVVGG